MNLKLKSLGLVMVDVVEYIVLFEPSPPAKYFIYESTLTMGG